METSSLWNSLLDPHAVRHIAISDIASEKISAFNVLYTVLYHTGILSIKETTSTSVILSFPHEHSEELKRHECYWPLSVESQVGLTLAQPNLSGLSQYRPALILHELQNYLKWPSADLEAQSVSCMFTSPQLKSWWPVNTCGWAKCEGATSASSF